MSKLLQALEQQRTQEIILPGISDKVLVRPLTMHEDIILSGSSFLSSKTVYLKLLEALYGTIKSIDGNKITFEQFLQIATNADIYALAYAALINSYTSLQVMYSCMNCGATNTAEYKTTKLQIDEIKPVFGYYKQDIEPFEYELGDNIKIQFKSIPVTIASIVQMIHFYERLEPDHFTIKDMETWLFNVLNAMFDVPNTIKLVLIKVAGLQATIGEEVEKYTRDVMDIYLRNPKNFDSINMMYKILDKLPVEISDKFINDYEKRVTQPDITFKSMKHKCKECKTENTIEVDPILFFLVKALKAS